MKTTQKLRDAIKCSLSRALGFESKKEDEMINFTERTKQLVDLGLTLNCKTMTYTYKDFNVDANEMTWMSDEEWLKVLNCLKDELKRIAELKPFKDIDDETCVHYWGILASKCGGHRYLDNDRKEFITYLKDIDANDPILTKVSENWDMIMKEFVQNYYIPTIKLGQLIWMEDWEHYIG